MAFKEKRHEAFVGLFLLVGLLVLGALVVKFGKLGENSMDGKYNIELIFKDASGLIKGSEVRMGGARIGKVTNTPELTEDLTVTLELRLDGRIRIDKDSIFQIQSLSLIGDKMIVVLPPEVKSGEYIEDGAVLVGGGQGGLDAIQSDAESVAKDARVLMKDARTTLLKVDASLDEIRLITGRLAESIDKVNNGLLDDNNVQHISNSLANIEKITEDFRDIGNEIKPTFDEAREAIAGVKSAVATAERTFADASEQIKKIEPTLEAVPAAISSIETAAKKAGQTMDTAKVAISDIGSGSGLLGTLSNDKEFDTDTKQFVKNLKHYGILRYKDKATYDEKDPKENRYRSRRRR